jgi:hypothetical protein
MSLLPENIVNYLFNLDRGGRRDRFCRKCGEITSQVAISYSDIPAFRGHEVQRIAGRLLDFVPGMSVLSGRPTVCECRTVNR